jgi:hypothetical protein
MWTGHQIRFNNNLTQRLLELATQNGYLFDTQDFTFVTVRDRIRSFYNAFVSQKRKGLRNMAHKEDDGRHRCDNGPIGHGPSRNGRSLGTPPTTRGLNPGLDSLDRDHGGPNLTISPSLSLNHARYSQLQDATTRALTKPGKDSRHWRQAGDDSEPSCRRVSLERQPLQATQGSLMVGGCGGGGSQNSFTPVTTRPGRNSGVANAAPDRFMGDEAHSVEVGEAGAIPPGLLVMVVKLCTPVLNQRYQSCEHRRLAQDFLREGRWYHPTDADQRVEWWVHESPRRVHILMQQQALERTDPPKDHHENRTGPKDKQFADTTPTIVCSTEGPVNGTQRTSNPVQTGSASPNASLHESRRWDTPMAAFRLDAEASSHKELNVGLDGGPCSVSPAPRLTVSRSPFNFFQPPSFPADMVPSPALPVTGCPSRTAPCEALVVHQSATMNTAHPPTPPKLERGLLPTLAEPLP